MNLGKGCFFLVIFSVFIHSSIYGQFAYRGSLSTPHAFGWLNGITIDSQGKIYVSDATNAVVQVFNSDNSFAFKFGTAGSEDGKFNNPDAIVIDETNGFIYVSDRLNYRVQKFTMNGTFVSVIGGFDSTGDTNGKFYLTSGLALDSQGNLYVCDQRKIQKFDTQGNFIANIITLDQPRDLEIDQNGNLFISQWNEKRILKTSPTGTVLETFTSLDYPSGLDLDVNGELFATYFSPEGTPRYNVRKFTNNLEYATGYGKNGTAPGEFADLPPDVAVKSNGLYATEHTRVQFFEFVPAPELRLFSNDQELPLNGYHFFGSTTFGNSVEQSFEIYNSGSEPLEVSNPTVSEGFELVGTFPTIIAADAKANFTIKMLAASEGWIEGVLQFETNDSDELVWKLSLSGVVDQGIQATQTIMFDSIPDLDVTQSPITLVASASSGLPVSFTVVSGPAVLIGPDRLSFYRAGAVTIEATQAGNEHYLAASPKRRYFESFVITASEHDLRTNALHFYPNPASQFVLITSDSPIPAIVLYDIAGKEIKNIRYKSGENFLDVSQVPNGVYLVRYRLPGNRIEQQRLIVNK